MMTVICGTCRVHLALEHNDVLIKIASHVDVGFVLFH